MRARERERESERERARERPEDFVDEFEIVSLNVACKGTVSDAHLFAVSLYLP